MNTFSRDLRFGWRMIRKNPVFSLVVILTLALGIGANTAIFTLVNSVILRPLPFPQPDELMVLNESHESIAGMSVAYLNFLDWRTENSVFESLAAHRNENYNLTGVERPVRVKASQVSAGFFEMMGASARVGRTFDEADDKPGAERVAVLTHGLWVSHFGEDPAILSGTIHLDGEPYTVVGVTLPGFDFALSDTDSEIYVPIGLNEDRWKNRGNHPGIYVLGRLKDGVSRETATANMAAIAKRLEEAYPDSNTGNSVRIRSLYEVAVRTLRTPLLILLGAVGFVLLIACGNVANLLLVRASTRTPEMAVRTAIGASRIHVARQLLTESILLAGLGGLLGVLVGVAATRGLLALLPDSLPRLEEVAIDLRVLGFTAALCLLTGVLFGIAPAVAAARVNLQTMLKEGGRGGMGSRNYLRRFLIGFEVAMAVVLLVGASLMIRSFYNVLRADSGFDPNNVLTLQFSLPQGEYPEPRQQAQFVEQLLRNVRSLPGVEAAGVSTPLLGGWQTGIYVEGTPIPKPGETHLADIGRVSPEFMDAMRLKLLKGRHFNEYDTQDSPRVMIVDERLAERYWPGKDPLGKRVKFGRPDGDDPWMEVVGVVSHVKNYGVDQDSRIEIFLPYAQSPVRWTTLAVRAAGDPHALASPVAEEIRRVDPVVPTFEVQTMEEYLADNNAPRRVVSTLMGAFAGTALLLAAIGLYGLMSYSVTQRYQEIGVRMALGADRGAVLRNFVSQGLKLSSAGLVVGLGASYAVNRLIESQLFGVDASDTLSFALMTGLLLAVAAVAAYLPARRAAAVDPMIALRYE